MKWIFLLLLLPQVAFALDVPAPVGHVNDLAGLLSPEERLMLQHILEQTEQNTTAEIAVLIIPTLEDENLEEYATRVFREWGVGKADVNNGILILVAVQEREVRIEVGTGAEGVVTDLMAGMIIRNRITPAFQRQAYFEGLAQASGDIAGLLSGDPAVLSAYEERQAAAGAWLPAIILMAIYTVIFFMIYRAKKRSTPRQERHVKTLSFIMLGTAYIAGIFTSMMVFWFVMFFVIMLNVTATGSPGMLFFPGGRFGGGGSGGFGGFGGGFSGGGGSSGGW